MLSLKEIVLPTDLSQPSLQVARSAADVARYFNAKITVLNVLPPVNPAWAATGDVAVMEKVFQQQKEETAKSLDRVLANVFPGLRVNRLIFEGDPAEAIAGYVGSEHVDLVMMSTRGCSAFRRFLLGSVTAKVLHDVSCPVWTSSHTGEGHWTVSAIPKVIVCAADPSKDGDAVIRWAADLAANLGARLVVTHAVRAAEVHAETYFLEADMRRSLVRDARDKISRLMRGSAMPDAEVRVEGGSVPAVVRSVIEDSRADLLVLGRSTGNGALGHLRAHS
jgi:nucleotide-binding universal stress UspA family protein